MCAGRRHRRQAIRAIWAAKHYDTPLRRYLKVVRTLRDIRPKAVAALRRDFRLLCPAATLS